MKITKFAAALTVLSVFAQPVFSKPMPSPTLEEAVKSPVVLVAQYVDYKPFLEPVTYMDGVMGHYLVKTVLKGSSPKDPHINVPYAFHDGSACLPDKDWKFTEDVMPKKGSGWILFLTPPNWKSSNTDNAFTTYRGDFGRLAATTDNIAKVKKLLGEQK